MPSICGKEDFWGPAVRCWQCLSSNRNKPADGSKVATPRSFHRTLSRRRTREHALHHLTLNFSQTFRAEASSQQAEVHLQAPPTLTSRLVWQHRCDINDDGKRCLLLQDQASALQLRFPPELCFSFTSESVWCPTAALVFFSFPDIMILLPLSSEQHLYCLLKVFEPFWWAAVLVWLVSMLPFLSVEHFDFVWYYYKYYWLNFTARSDPYSTVSWFVVVLVQRCAHSVRFVCVCPSSFYNPNVELQ